MSTQNALCTGTITVTAGSATVPGAGSNFDPQVKKFIDAGAYCFIKFIDNGGVYRALQVKSVESDTSLTLWAVAPTGSTATAVTFYAGDVLDTYLQPGLTGTGTIGSTGGVNSITGSGTNFDPQTPNGTLLTWLSNAGAGQSGTVNVVTNDTALTLAGLASATSTAKAFVYKTGGQGSMYSEFTGGDGNRYIFVGINLLQFCPAGAVAAAVALGWGLVASPAAPSPPAAPPGDQTLLPPTNDSTAYDVIGQDGITYHLQPWNDSGTWNLYVPSMAVNAALEDGWTI